MMKTLECYYSARGAIGTVEKDIFQHRLLVKYVSCPTGKGNMHIMQIHEGMNGFVFQSLHPLMNLNPI